MSWLSSLTGLFSAANITNTQPNTTPVTVRYIETEEEARATLFHDLDKYFGYEQGTVVAVEDIFCMTIPLSDYWYVPNDHPLVRLLELWGDKPVNSYDSGRLLKYKRSVFEETARVFLEEEDEEEEAAEEPLL